MDLENALALIPLLPLLGFAVNGLLGKRIAAHLGRRAVAGVACLGPVLAFLLAVRLFRHLHAGGAPIDVTLYTWITAGDLTIDMRLVCDQLTAVMLLVITGVGSLIHIYSAEYMEHERGGGYARYFAYLNLFMAMMLVLVTGASLPLMFVGWEGVGLCSYLLIGYWFEDTKNADAGRKAFVVNRIGDFGFLLGMFLLWTTVGSLDFAGLRAADLGLLSKQNLTLACVLLFVGACGKSAQIPLYVWLPDAMAGPTPVSALIHAATMVTAGVYMVARLGFVFVHAPIALGLVALVGALTAFFAATMAMAEHDLKKVLAYSTVSQLGYMFIGVGTGVFAAGIFHLVTHAFFKALLFLGAGAVMHAFHHMDMRRFGALKDRMPVTYWTFLVGALGLAGIPPLSGFFSKDEILGGALANFLGGHGAGWALIWLLGLVTAGLTAFYTFRAVLLTFHGSHRGTHDEYLHAHDAGHRILVPLIVLAGLAGLGGFLNVAPLFGGHAWLSHFLEPAIGGVHHEGHEGVLWLGVAITVAVGLLGVWLAYRIYALRDTAWLEDRFARHEPLRRWRELAAEKYHVDETYGRLVVEPIAEGSVSLWKWVDVGAIDNTVNRVGQSARSFGEVLRRVQAGFLHQYLVYLAGGAIAVLVILMG